MRKLDIIKKKPKNNVDIPRDLLNNAKLFVNTLTYPEFDLREFEDPSLQKFYSHLQALALHE